MSFQILVWIVVIVCLGFLFLVLFVYQILRKYDKVTEIKSRELVFIFFTLLGTTIVSSFVVQKRKIFVYLSYVFYRILYGTIFQNGVAAGLFVGFMTTAKLGYLYYLFVVPRFVFDNYEDSFCLEHHQKRVGAMASFLIGQLVMFTSVYHPTLHETLVQPDYIFLLFIVFCVTQVLWVGMTIVRNWRYLYPRDKRKRVVRRIVLLQGEFMCNFFLQLSLLPSNSYIEHNSKVRRLVNTYLKNNGNWVVADQTKKLFLQTSFLGWLIGQIFFMIFYIKLFQLILMITTSLINWLRRHFFEK